MNVRLPESFSIGVVFRDQGAANVLLRVNGDHGTHKNPDGVVVEGPHVHLPWGPQLDEELPEEPWKDGPPFAVPLFVEEFRLFDAWALLGTIANIVNAREAEEKMRRASQRLDPIGTTHEEQLDLFEEDDDDEG